MDKRLIRRWSNMRGLKVVIQDEGRTVGNITDFYVHAQTNAVHSFHVHTPISGDFCLYTRMIYSIEQAAITTASEEMLVKEFPPFQHGKALIGCTITSESGKELGTVRDVLIGITPVAALRIAGFEVVLSSGDVKVMQAQSVLRYDDHVVVIYDQIAASLR